MKNWWELQVVMDQRYNKPAYQEDCQVEFKELVNPNKPPFVTGNGKLECYNVKVAGPQNDVQMTFIVEAGQGDRVKNLAPGTVVPCRIKMEPNSTAFAINGYKYTIMFPKNGGSGGNQGGYQQNSAPQQQQYRQSAPASRPKQENPDWDKIARGKCSCAVICAAIQSGQLRCQNKEDVVNWVNIMMEAGR